MLIAGPACVLDLYRAVAGERVSAGMVAAGFVDVTRDVAEFPANRNGVSPARQAGAISISCACADTMCPGWIAKVEGTVKPRRAPSMFPSAPPMVLAAVVAGLSRAAKQLVNVGVKVGRGRLYGVLDRRARMAGFAIEETGELGEFNERPLLVEKLEPGARHGSTTITALLDDQLAKGCPLMPLRLIKADGGLPGFVDGYKISQVRKPDRGELLEDPIGGDIEGLVGAFRDPADQFLDPCGNLGVLQHLDRAAMGRGLFRGVVGVAGRFERRRCVTM